MLLRCLILVIRHLSNMSIATSHDSKRKINKKNLFLDTFLQTLSSFEMEKVEHWRKFICIISIIFTVNTFFVEMTNTYALQPFNLMSVLAEISSILFKRNFGEFNSTLNLLTNCRIN